MVQEVQNVYKIPRASPSMTKHIEVIRAPETSQGRI